jgi:putative oxidoreductase
MATAIHRTDHGDKLLRGSLWTAQIVLAALFGTAGVLKITQPIHELAQMIGWPGVVPEWLVRFIGACELAGAVGLVVPAATRILPRLTPLAALGLLTIMMLASMFHIARGEVSALPITFTLGALAAFVVWGRGVAAPIDPRQSV